MTARACSRACPRRSPRRAIIRWWSRTFRPSLIVNATSETPGLDGTSVMGFRHETLPIHGVQFHPESIATAARPRAARQLPRTVRHRGKGTGVSALPPVEPHLSTKSEAEAAFGAMLDGATSEDEIARFLSELSDRGETATEIAGAARAMRARLIPIEAPDDAIDVCGTGGDGTTRSTSRPRWRWWSRPAGCRSPSTATARRAPRPARPTRSKRSASTWKRAGRTAEETLRRARHLLPVRRAITTRRCAASSRSASASAGGRSST